MITGKGTPVLHSGLRIELAYQFGSDYGDTRAGYRSAIRRRLTQPTFATG
jgi:hypothetical protein